MRFLFALPLLLGVLTARPAAQTPSGGDSSAPPLPPPASPAQQRFLQGLRTAGRGVAQIKDGIDRLNRAQGTHDSTQVVMATRRLGGMCTAARGFIVSGRGRMEPTAYAVPTRKPARELVLQLDSLSVTAKECQATAGKAPQVLVAGLMTRLRSYEAALAGFRSAMGLPNR
jgi:hypothetical protein